MEERRGTLAVGLFVGRFSRADVHRIFCTLEEDPSVCNVNFGGLMRGGAISQWISVDDQ